MVKSKINKKSESDFRPSTELYFDNAEYLPIMYKNSIFEYTAKFSDSKVAI